MAFSGFFYLGVVINESLPGFIVTRAMSDVIACFRSVNKALFVK
jgi:hypothetical protein